MYTKYFGFHEKPFTLTPNPRFIFLSKYHKEAFAHLLYGINNHHGFIELIGEVGTGKPTVLRTLLNQLHEDNYRTALIVNPCLTGIELLRSICHEFGLATTSEYANELLTEINRFLLREAAAGRTVVLVIDESQNLQPVVLEQIRLISNLETNDDKLIQIILAGQPELVTLLERPELRQLNQRIAVRYRLKSMSMLETRTYIRHRMEVAGKTDGVSFTLFATRLIYLYTRGVPRMINILCDRCLLMAYGNERRRITAHVVTSAIKELLNVPRRKRLSLAVTILTVIAAVSILAITLGIWRPVNQSTEHPSPDALKSAQTRAALAGSVPHAEDQRLESLKQEILMYDQNYAHMLAFNAVADSWKVKPLNTFNGRLTVPDMYSNLATKRGLMVTAFTGTLDEAIRFDIPFLTETKVTGSHGDYCLAVTSVKDANVSVSPPLFGTVSLSRSDLNSIATGIYYLVWQNPGHIPTTIQKGATSVEIRTLQHLLQHAGVYNDAPDGTYSIATAKAVTDFQQASGIRRNEAVGELTLAALTKYYVKPKVPSLTSAGSSP